jgi:hypothetical protein
MARLGAADNFLSARETQQRFIGYFRVSTLMQGIDGNGMAAQRETVRRFVASQNGILESGVNRSGLAFGRFFSVMGRRDTTPA